MIEFKLELWTGLKLSEQMVDLSYTSEGTREYRDIKEYYLTNKRMPSGRDVGKAFISLFDLETADSFILGRTVNRKAIIRDD